ncbi:MAG: hypothetical protein JMDDDDMK_03217 [Acidobacteria bacterium]|nr:hypothetical protein [Acidobacteriota bacterium]
MKAVRSFLLICFLAAAVSGQGREAGKDYAQVDLKDFVNRPADYLGRRVAVTAEVVSVSADYRAIDVFDSRSKALIGVSLTQLPWQLRQTLVVEPVRRVSVYGRIEMKRGRVVIKADRVTPLESTLVARK